MELPSTYQSIVHRSRYSRFLPSEKRRETWEETVDRLIDYFSIKAPAAEEALRGDIKQAILNLDIVPSMRALMTAGEACDRDNIAAYNCSYLAVNSKRAFSEALYILMNGTGVGFSCE